MPGFDGTGPQGRGPLTGRGMGFCVLKKVNDEPGHIEGFIGMQSMAVNKYYYDMPDAAGGYIRSRNPLRGCGHGFRGGRGRFRW